jgi:MFS family permease
MQTAPDAPPWWRGRWFVRLLAVRVTGQVGDGVFQGALASYALFAQDQARAGELATAAAVVLLPYSLLGPYVGVLLDRWSRRQVLLAGNLVRALVLALLAAAVLRGLPDPAVYGGALLALGANRFLLAGLSAALPHTVPAADLTAANAVTPTVGTGAFVAGLAAAGLLKAGAVGPGVDESALLGVAAVVYLGAGSLALLIPRALLGPVAPRARPRPRLRHLAAGLVEGARHLASRRLPAAALSALGAMRLWFGLLTISAVLSLRNQAADEPAAVAALGAFTVATGAGFLGAAVAAPVVAHRWGRGRTVVVALVVAATAGLAPALSSDTWSWWVMGGLLGLGAQGTKICVDAIVQAGVDDDVRGRVFSLYDMAFNVAFVVAAALAVLVVPASGRSPVVLLVSSTGLLVTAAAFHLSACRPRASAAEARAEAE